MQVKAVVDLYQILIFTRNLCVLPTVHLCLGSQCAYGSKHRTEWPPFVEVVSGSITINEYPHISTGSDTV